MDQNGGSPSPGDFLAEVDLPEGEQPDARERSNSGNAQVTFRDLENPMQPAGLTCGIKLNINRLFAVTCYGCRGWAK
jgi:hypothetical protein